MTRATTAQALLDSLDRSPHPFVLDVREPDEFAEWHIDGAVNIPLATLSARTAGVPRDREVVTVCAAGVRAAQAASTLAAAGIAAAVLDGGMTAWAHAYDEAELDIAGATVVQVRRRGKGCLSYIVGASGAAVVIDPSSDIDQYVTRAAARGWAITHVLDTHLHADHVSGARALAAATGAQLMCNPQDGFRFDFTAIDEGVHVPVGPAGGPSLRAIRAPGHTMGSTVFTLADAAVFTGDTLFLDSVGRPDLADEAERFAHALFRTLHDEVLRLPGTAVVLPAHYGDGVDVRAHAVVASTLLTLSTTLPALALDEASFVAWAVGAVSARPPRYVSIVAVNAGIATVTDDERAGLDAGPNRCAVAR